MAHYRFGVLLATTIFAGTGCSAPAPQAEPVTANPRTSASPPSQAPQRPAAAPVPQRVHIVVSGPYDTLMRVARAGTATQVALQGQPFDFTFTEHAASVSDLGIAVFAKTDSPGASPLSCKITVNGRTVAQETATGPGERGFAEVSCVIAASV